MPSILIYDLNKAGREAIREALSVHEEWELLSAATRSQALQCLQDDPVDLVVVDAQTLERTEDAWLPCRAPDGRAQVPVVVLAADSRQNATIVEELLLGSASYAPGSTGARDLVKTVEQVLQLAGRGRRHPLLSETQQTTETRFTLDHNNLTLLPILAQHLSWTCEEFEIGRGAIRRQVAVALEKAMFNAIVFGNLQLPLSLPDWDDDAFFAMVRDRQRRSPYRERKLRVSASFAPHDARFSIRHEGPALEAVDLSDAPAGGLETPYVRGLLLIRTFMDQVTFYERANTLHLLKRAPAHSPLQPDAVTT
jgi:DNA-binding response OmpR family regulator